MIYVKKTPEQIHYNMQRVKCKNTEIELRLRKELWSRGVRYRKNVSKITGKPDIAFIGKKLQCSVIANFGTDMIGKDKERQSKVTETFGFLKLKEISSEIRKSTKH